MVISFSAVQRNLLKRKVQNLQTLQKTRCVSYLKYSFKALIFFSDLNILVLLDDTTYNFVEI